MAGAISWQVQFLSRPLCITNSRDFFLQSQTHNFQNNIINHTSKIQHFKTTSQNLNSKLKNSQNNPKLKQHPKTQKSKTTQPLQKILFNQKFSIQKS